MDIEETSEVRADRKPEVFAVVLCSTPRKRESRDSWLKWIPAFAGMTGFRGACARVSIDPRAQAELRTSSGALMPAGAGGRRSALRKRPLDLPFSRRRSARPGSG